MKALILSLLLVAIAAPALADYHFEAENDPERAAKALAVKTPRSFSFYESFQNIGVIPVRNYVFAGRMNARLEIVELKVNGIVVLPLGGKPLHRFPFPARGETRNLSVVVFAHEEEIAPADPMTSYVAVGSAYLEEVYRGDVVSVTLTPNSLRVWVPFVAPADSSNFRLYYQGQVATLTSHGGETGFWVYFDPMSPDWGYQIRSANGLLEEGDLDGFSIVDSVQTQGRHALAVGYAGGAQVTDLRGAYSTYNLVKGSLDGRVGEPMTPAAAVAIRTEEHASIEVRYSGPPAWLVLQEVGADAQPVLYDGVPRVVTIDARGDSFGSALGAFWSGSGSVVMTVYPAQSWAAWSKWQAIVTKSNAKG